MAALEPTVAFVGGLFGAEAEGVRYAESPMERLGWYSNSQ